jgi:hypothetical protein
VAALAGRSPANAATIRQEGCRGVNETDRYTFGLTVQQTAYCCDGAEVDLDPPNRYGRER